METGNVVALAAAQAVRPTGVANVGFAEETACAAVVSAAALAVRSKSGLARLCCTVSNAIGKDT